MASGDDGSETMDAQVGRLTRVVATAGIRVAGRRGRVHSNKRQSLTIEHSRTEDWETTSLFGHIARPGDRLTHTHP